MVWQRVHGKIRDLGTLTPTLGCLLLWTGFLAIALRDREGERDCCRAVLGHSRAAESIAALEEIGEPMPLEVNGIGMQLVFIPAGSFMMGSLSSDPYHAPDERRRRVRIDSPFYLGAHEVTVGQFAQFARETGYRTEAERSERGAFGWVPWNYVPEQGGGFSWRNPGFSQTSEHPVTCVTWNDALHFCDWLTRRERRGYRLPTEAEWEYACRAGSGEPFSVPEIASCWPEGNLATSPCTLGDWVDRPRDGFRFTAPVGHYAPNAWGLYDMHGNVCEWCADGYGGSPPRHSPQKAATLLDTQRVIRGASFYDAGPFARSANRSGRPPTAAEFNQGFRVVCDLPPR